MLLFSLLFSVHAAEFYVDPTNGSQNGDGSASSPWLTLEQVIADDLFETQTWDALPYVDGTSTLVAGGTGPIGPGDTLWLRSGHHGEALITAAYPTSNITIAAQSGHTPTLSKLQLRSVSNWTVSGLTVSPSYASTYARTPMITIENHSWTGPSMDITVEDCTAFSVDDMSAWTANDWDTLAANGIEAAGDNHTIRKNSLRNVNFGISVTATSSLIEGNLVENFSGDGLRGLGDYSTFQYNRVQNCYDVNENHDDGFQSWSVGDNGVGTGEVTGITVRGNVIINNTDPNQPLRGPLQGIGGFDGTFVDWVIENNVIVVDHWHGITLLGTRNVRIVNNTVVDINQVSPGPPWIRIDDHKDGTPSQNGLVRNNLTTDLSSGTNVTEDYNVIVGVLADHFVNYPDDMRLIATSTAIDAGEAAFSPSLDADEVARPQGKGVDAGAYEYVESDTDTDTDTDSDTDADTDTDTNSNTGRINPSGADDLNCGCASQTGSASWLGLALLFGIRRRRAMV